MTYVTSVYYQYSTTMQSSETEVFLFMKLCFLLKLTSVVFEYKTYYIFAIHFLGYNNRVWDTSAILRGRGQKVVRTLKNIFKSDMISVCETMFWYLNNESRFRPNKALYCTGRLDFTLIRSYTRVCFGPGWHYLFFLFIEISSSWLKYSSEAWI